jgi:neutral ceramidase
VKKRWAVLAVILVLALGLAMASVDRCGTPEARAPQVIRTASGRGVFHVGAAREPFKIPFPVTVAGMPPLRAEAMSAETELSARAILIDSGGSKIALVSLEILFVSAGLQRAIEAAFDFPVIVTATHTHSSLGQFDMGIVAQVAALGRYREDCFDAIVSAAISSVERANKKLIPSRLQIQRSTHALCAPRSGNTCDASVSSLEFVSLSDEKRVTRLVLAAAHPTYEKFLHGDWPHWLSHLDEESHGGVTAVLQTALGNSSADKTANSTSHAFAQGLLKVLDVAPIEHSQNESFSFARVALALPRPDASRLVPFIFQGVLENIQCRDMEPLVPVSSVRISGTKLLFVPGEATYSTAQLLEQTGAHVVSLADAYVGYVEPKSEVQKKSGESKRQYFSAELFERISEAATVALQLSP